MLKKGKNVTNKKEAYEVALDMRKKYYDDNDKIDYVLKAQVHAGGRGKGYFKENGLKGGVLTCDTPEEVKSLVKKMCGNTLITKQTGSSGKPCNSVYIVERVFLRKELYFGMFLDRKNGGLTIVTSEKGGGNIESIESKFIHTFHINANENEISPEIVEQIVNSFNISKTHDKTLEDVII